MDTTYKKQRILFTIIACLLISFVIGITYAYFSSSVSNTNNEKINASTATLSLVFEDNDNGVSGTLNLGQSITKKFTIENTGTVDTYAKINWYNLVNTYTSDSLTWTLDQSTSENGTYTSIGSGKVPTSSTQTTKQLKNGILVPVNTTYYYKLTITLNNLDVNQNSDINASFYSYFSLEEGSLSGADTIQNLVAGEPTNTTDVITKPAPAGSTCTNTLAYDGTVDNNLRYVGANPCNYVTFNGETAGWRIVGIMNNVDDGTGVTETRIKLIRGSSLGDYSWDTSDSSVNSGYGVNDWTQADLKNELNGDYLDTTLTANTNWYNERNNAQTRVFDYTKRLSATAQTQIENAKWYLGGIEYMDADLIPSTLYSLERGTKVWGSTMGQICNDGYCPRATEWTGKVALIYISDLGFAAGGEERNICLENDISLTTDYNTYNCYNYIRSGWFLSTESGSFNRAWAIDWGGRFLSQITHNSYPIVPTVYLKSEVTISGGNGTESEPYVLE